MLQLSRDGRGLFLAVAALVLISTTAAAQELNPDDPPFIATPTSLAEQMLALAGVTPADVVYDLGSGDGRLVIAAATLGARSVGIEYDAALVAESRANAEAAGVGARVTFHHQDIFETDINEASVVLLYLSPGFNLRLRPILLDQLRPGSRVVSHGFHMGDWEPDTLVVVGSGAQRAHLYGWVIPIDIDGFWSLEIEGTDAQTLELFQRYQELSGSLRGDRRSLELRNGTVRGESVGFEAIDATGGSDLRLRFEGDLADGRMTGVIYGPAPWGGRRWRAVRFSDPSLAPD